MDYVPPTLCRLQFSPGRVSLNRSTIFVLNDLRMLILKKDKIFSIQLISGSCIKQISFYGQLGTMWTWIETDLL